MSKVRKTRSSMQCCEQNFGKAKASRFLQDQKVAIYSEPPCND